MYQIRPTMRDVTITLTPNGSAKAAIPSGTMAGGAKVEFGSVTASNPRPPRAQAK